MVTTTRRPLSVPTFVRIRTRAWGRDGCGLTSYLAAIVDRADLEDARVLAIDGTTDLLLDVVNADVQFGELVAVESDLVSAAFFVSHVNDSAVKLLTGDFADPPGAMLSTLAEQDPFDVVVVRSPSTNLSRPRLSEILQRTRALSAEGTRLVVNILLSRRTLRGNSASDRLIERGDVDEGDDDVQVESVVDVHGVEQIDELCAENGWRLDEVCEPRRGFGQHHIVLTAVNTGGSS